MTNLTPAERAKRYRERRKGNPVARTPRQQRSDDVLVLLLTDRALPENHGRNSLRTMRRRRQRAVSFANMPLTKMQWIVDELGLDAFIECCNHWVAPYLLRDDHDQLKRNIEALGGAELLARLELSLAERMERAAAEPSLGDVGRNARLTAGSAVVVSAKWRLCLGRGCALRAGMNATSIPLGWAKKAPGHPPPWRAAVLSPRQPFRLD